MVWYHIFLLSQGIKMKIICASFLFTFVSISRWIEAQNMSQLPTFAGTLNIHKFRDQLPSTIIDIKLAENFEWSI